MKLIACLKFVPDEQDLTVKADHSLDMQRAEPKINPFDLNALEAAVEIASQNEGSQVTALSAGGRYLENGKVRKDILARGADALTLVIDDALHQASPYQTAHALTAAIKQTDYELVICGDGSGDLHAQQVGTLLGELLGVPNINAVSKIVSTNHGKLVVERTLEDQVDVLEMNLPAVISVTADINVPKIPNMKAILAAGKKPMNVLKLSDMGITEFPALTLTQSTLAPEQTDRKKIIIEGDGEEQLNTFISHLQKVLN